MIVPGQGSKGALINKKSHCGYRDQVINVILSRYIIFINYPEMFKIPEYFLPKIAFLQFILIIFLHNLININLKIVRPIYFRSLPSRNI